MRRYLSILAAVAIALAAAGARADEILNIGDPAPKLDVSGWVKGEKVEAFEPGKTYVVAFWTTSLSPANRRCVPYLTEAARRCKDKSVRFIGVAIWEGAPERVKSLVDEMGDRIQYSVAIDDVPAGRDSKDGVMARTWMAAAEERGLPTAFIIRDGRIAWIGYTMSLDWPLARITAGQWDLAMNARARLFKKARERKVVDLDEKVKAAHRTRDYQATLSAIEAASSSIPELAQEYAGLKLDCLCRAGQIDEAVTFGNALLDRHRDSPSFLNDTFFPIIDLRRDQAPDPRVVQVALKVARRAAWLTKGANLDVVDTLAVAQFRAGEPAAAAATIEDAFKRLKARDALDAHPNLKTFQEHLETFRQAAEAKGAKSGADAK